MKNKSTYDLILSAVLASVICVLTIAVQIPLPGNGYANLGDSVLLTAACILSPVHAAAAAAIGSALGDLILGCAAYIPATIIIKGSMALIASLLVKKLTDNKSKVSVPARLAVYSAAELLMTFGYFFYEAFILSYGMGALAAVPGNLMQGAVSIAVSLVLGSAVYKLKNH